MRKRLVFVGLATAALFPLLASARHADVSDPNDTRGVLDMSRVEMLRGSPPRWKVTTRSGWKASEIWDRGFILVFLDMFGGQRADYYALVRSDEDKLRASLYRDRKNKDDRRLRSIRVRHPKRKVVTVTIRFKDLRRRDSELYNWYALTMISSKRCKRFCFDRAPDSGTVAEPGPVPTPTATLPSPTPTVPTPTPSP